jgi:tetratricopeptide (TPR) repeat protein
LHRRTGYRQGEGIALGNIGVVYKAKGEFGKALKYYEEALVIDREVGYQEGVAGQLGNIGCVYLGQGELDKALKYLVEALRAFAAIGMRPRVEQTHTNLALLLGQMGRDRFVAGCVRAGFCRSEADKLADSLAKPG